MMVDAVVCAGSVNDDLSEVDYRDMLAELRGKFTFAQLVDVCGSRFSGAYWSKIERGAAPFSREVRAELRRLHGLPALRPTVAEAVAGVPAGAAIMRVAHDDSSQVNRLILVGGIEDVSIFHNGAGAGWRLAPDGGVTEVTRAQERTDGTDRSNDTFDALSPDFAPPVAVSAYSRAERRRRRLIRPVVAPVLDRRRAALGVTWKDVIEVGLATLESAQNGV